MRTDDQRAAAFGQVLELALLVNDDMTRSLGRDGLTPSRAHLLWELRGRGPSTQSVLAEALGVSPRNVTGLVDGLVATGFVTREPHPTDRRATLVSFTDRGARTAAELEQGQHEFASVLFDGMPDRRFDGLVQGLADVLDRLRAALAPAEARP